MKNANWIGIRNIVATIVVVGASFLTDWLNEQKMERKIHEYVSEWVIPLIENQKES